MVIKWNVVTLIFQDWTSKIISGQVKNYILLVHGQVENFEVSAGLHTRHGMIKKKENGNVPCMVCLLSHGHRVTTEGYGIYRA